MLDCVMWDLAPWPGIEPESSALGVWGLIHWATQEVQGTVSMEGQPQVLCGFSSGRVGIPLCSRVKCMRSSVILEVFRHPISVELLDCTESLLKEMRHLLLIYLWLGGFLCYFLEGLEALSILFKEMIGAFGELILSLTWRCTHWENLMPSSAEHSWHIVAGTLILKTS